jgi:HPt (histidine-containing phosphotransfer) domain-containing protein
VEPAEDPEDPIQSVLAALAVSARRANLARSAVLADALEAVARGRLDEQQRGEATEAAHKLVGSAGTFGSRRASELAASLEHFFEDGDDATREAGLDQARSQLAELRLALEPGHQVEE